MADKTPRLTSKEVLLPTVDMPGPLGLILDCVEFYKSKLGPDFFYLSSSSPESGFGLRRMWRFCLLLVPQIAI